GALLKANLPGRLSAPLPEPFAGVVEIRLVLRVKDIHAQSDETFGGQRGWKRTKVFAAVALFFQEDISVFRALDKNQIIEIVGSYRAGVAIGVDILRFDVLRGHELFKIGELPGGAKLRPLEQIVF